MNHPSSGNVPPRSRLSRIVRCVTAATLVGLALSGCSISPTTTVTGDDGTEVTVNWADYPASADADMEAVLAWPSERDVEPIADALFTEIQAALDAEFDLTWSMTGEEGWHPSSGNGYGGESRLTTYNSRSLESDGAPSAPADWATIIDRVSAVTESSGLGPTTLDHETVPPGEDPKLWKKDFTNRFGTEDPDDYWMWTGMAYENSQWMSIMIVDTGRDHTGKAAKEYSDDGTEKRFIGIFYGATVVPDNERDAFMRALEPFEGLKRPPASHSD